MRETEKKTAKYKYKYKMVFGTLGEIDEKGAFTTDALRNMR